jgi:hypothetical protein
MVDLRHFKEGLEDTTMICVTRTTRNDLRYLKIKHNSKTYNETIRKLVADYILNGGKLK